MGLMGEEPVAWPLVWGSPTCPATMKQGCLLGSPGKSAAVEASFCSAPFERTGPERQKSQSPESTPTPWSDHGLGPPLSTENPRNKGFSGPGAPIFGFGLGDPATKG